MSFPCFKTVAASADALKNKKYYEFGDNKTEQMAKEYWKRIKGE
jgi:hypothetical protein